MGSGDQWGFEMLPRNSQSCFSQRKGGGLQMGTLRRIWEDDGAKEMGGGEAKLSPLVQWRQGGAGVAVAEIYCCWMWRVFSLSQ